VIHLAVHTFTPRLRGVRRKAAIGLLHDPERPGEAALSRLWREEIRRVAPRLRVRLNYPYRGWTGGLVTTLRAAYGPRSYIGVELEVSQRLLRKVDARARWVAAALRESLRAAIASR
jgi:predicted N-formylglutamate amidohydrolase